MNTSVYRHSGLLGTVVECRITSGSDVLDAAANEAALDEIMRLERIFTAFDPASEFSRWRVGTDPARSPELVELMGLVLEWQQRSGGGFNPMAGELTTRWRHAELDGRVPTEREMQQLAEHIGEPRFAMVDGVPVPTGDCTNLSIHAIAKGYIVDATIERMATQFESLDRWSVSVNAGGDLAHRGTDHLRVGIENPHRPYDNEPPVVSITLANAALATSGLARRGFHVADRWFGHVLDPRTGWPVESVASISVVAADAATADVVATAAGVLDPDDAVAFVAAIDDTEVFVIDRERQRHLSPGWPAE